MRQPDYGEQAELVVAGLVQEFIEQKIIFSNNHRIVHFIHAKKSDTWDSGGIDILIFFDSGLALPLQVKLSRKGIKRHQRRHPYVRHIFVVGRPHGKNVVIANKRMRASLIRKINSALNKQTS